MTEIRRMKACLNGGRAPGDHPGVPTDPAGLARAAEAAVAAGAEAIHLHPRDAAGRESLASADVGAAVTAVRAACPGIGVGVSTGLWITGGDPRARRAAVAGWAGLDDASRPDFASELDRTGAAELRLLHGEGDACWPLVAHAGALRLPGRIGLEDTLSGP